MKKISFVLFLTLFNIPSFTIPKNDACNFNGILDSPVNRKVEFQMLLEPDDHPSYLVMAEVVAKLTFIFEKDLKKMDPECTSIHYMRELLEFYNTSPYKEELANTHPLVSQVLQTLQEIMEKNAQLAPTSPLSNP